LSLHPLTADLSAAENGIVQDGLIMIVAKSGKPSLLKIAERSRYRKNRWHFFEYTASISCD
jgi:hypothetical protein